MKNYYNEIVYKIYSSADEDQALQLLFYEWVKSMAIRNYYNTIFILFLGLLGLLGDSALAAKIKDGKLNLSSYVFSKDNPVELKGSWRFYWSQHVDPQNKDLFSVPSARYLNVPGEWKKNKIGPEGFATYALQIELSDENELYGMYFPELPSSYTLFVNGKLVGSKGKVGKTVEDSKVGRGKAIYFFNAVAGKLNIVLHTSAFFHHTGGIWHAPKLNKAAYIADSTQGTSLLEGYLAGVLLIMGVYHVALYSLRRKQLEALYFALMCFTVAVRLLTMGESGPISRLIPGIESDWIKRFEYLGITLGAASFFSFFWSLFPRQFSRIAVNVSWLFSSILSLIIVATDQKFYGNLLPLVQLNCLYTAIGLWLFLAKAIKAKVDASILASVGVAILSAALINDILRSMNIIDSFELFPTGLSIYIFIQAYILARKFSRAFDQVELDEKTIKKLNFELEDHIVNLDQKVKEKTSEIRSILVSIEQGILTIVDEKGTIGPDFSEWLKRFFKAENIAGLTVNDLLLKKVDVAEDQIDMTRSVILSAIGESALNWTLNEQVFFKECQYREADGNEKSIEIDWTPILDENDIVTSLLLTIRDVTDIKRLQEEARKQEIELGYISEVLKVPVDKMEDFLNSSEQLVDDSINITQESDGSSVEIIHKIFRNLHTLKGNARSYGLQGIAQDTHIAEKHFSNWRSEATISWTKPEVENILKKSRDLISNYRYVNDVKLGRKNDNLDQIMVDRGHVEENINQLSKLDFSQLATDSRNIVRSIGAFFQDLVYHRLEHVLKDQIVSVSRLADDLNKEVPVFKFQDSGISIKREYHQIIRNIFIHLFRNSLDHGIEVTEQRLNQGKSAEGTITVEAIPEGESLVIGYYDDGGGLDLDNILKKAVDIGTVSSGKSMTRQNVANILISSGFTTKDKVTEISGRGVGLDAIQNFAKEQGASFEIVVSNPQSNELGRTPVRFCLTLPAKAFEVIADLDRNPTLSKAS